MGSGTALGGRRTPRQLHLALRSGLVREFGERAESLPVVVDEVLVNFDPLRAKQAAESFAALSGTNQVLVFTCHPGTAGLFAAAAGAQVIEVESASGANGWVRGGCSSAADRIYPESAPAAG